ncbi:DUF1707 domain-containing protein [Actinomadura sp. HBU206391]|uniref:DUF1707 SHOCT-like domain-containing protein n=1 Tax=Actinomadura sp. HBU206391 TaxID=2731692 RepID=UPI002905E2B1|nr:DUF1707 domain-containing protein [Actinomadura sp. HBU206391]
MDNPWRPATRGGDVPARDLRASDADREKVVALIGAALADGRLTMVEHGERMERAYAARTLGELSVLTLDLLPPEQQPIRVDDRPLHALFGSARRGGRWVAPARFPVTALFGSVELDLREAILQRSHIVIDANIVCGHVRLLIPEGVRVDVTSRMILSSRKLKIWVPPGAPDGPLIEIVGTAVMGSIQARTPKRKWRQRLRGR